MVLKKSNNTSGSEIMTGKVYLTRLPKLLTDLRRQKTTLTKIKLIMRVTGRKRMLKRCNRTSFCYSDLQFKLYSMVITISLEEVAQLFQCLQKKVLQQNKTSYKRGMLPHRPSILQ